jgi:hypothetical protein
MPASLGHLKAVKTLVFGAAYPKMNVAPLSVVPHVIVLA